MPETDEVLETLEAWARRLWELAQEPGFVAGQIAVWVGEGLMADVWRDEDREILFRFRNEDGPVGEPRVVLRADGTSASLT